MGKEDAMKRKRFSVEQIVTVLKQAEMGTSVADLIRHLGIAEQTFYRWKQRYARLESDQVRQFSLSSCRMRTPN
jgi:putative transposase